MVRIRTRLDFNAIPDQPVGADLGFVFGILRIAGAAQRSDDIVLTQCLAGMQLAGVTVNLCRIAEDLAAHAPVHNEFVFVVVVGEGGKTNRQRYQHRGHANLDASLRPYASRPGARAA